MRRPRWAVLLLVGAVSAASTAAWADHASEAKFRFDRGLQLYRQGRIREALDDFFVSHRLSPNPSVAFNIGSCLEVLGRYEEAFGAFSEYLSSTLSPEEEREGRSALDRVLTKVARLEITSSPPGADIYLDRRNLGQYGQTPRVLAAPPGERQVILVLDGHRVATATVTLERGKQSTLAIELTRLTAEVTIASEPAGARVHLDGNAQRDLGVTPLTTELPLGPHRITISRDGFRDAERDIEIRTGATTNTYRVTLDPKPAPLGEVRVLTNVASALISVDELEVGFSPFLGHVAKGQRTIAVSKPGYRPWMGTFEVDPAQAMSLDVNLEPVEQATGRGPWPWVILTTSAVAGVVGLTLTAVAVSERDDYEITPTREGYDRTVSLNTAADVMLSVSVLGGAATLAYFLFGDDAQEKDSSAQISHPASVTLSKAGSTD